MGIVGWIRKSSWRIGGAVAALVVTLVVVVALIVPFDAFCDGTYERWRLPDDYRGGGCPDVTPGQSMAVLEANPDPVGCGSVML